MKNKSDYYLRSKYYLLEQPMEQAIKFFADIKKLSVVEFNKIFIVKEIKNNDQ